MKKQNDTQVAPYGKILDLYVGEDIILPQGLRQNQRADGIRPYIVDGRFLVNLRGVGDIAPYVLIKFINIKNDTNGSRAEPLSLGGMGDSGNATIYRKTADKLKTTFSRFVGKPDEI